MRNQTIFTYATRNSHFQQSAVRGVKMAGNVYVRGFVLVPGDSGNLHVKVRNFIMYKIGQCRGFEYHSGSTLICFTFISGGCNIKCQNGGKCWRKNKCKCKKGYTGKDCSTRKHLVTELFLLKL